VPHEKSNPKSDLPHNEKVTQKIADLPVYAATGGQSGVNNAGEKGGYEASP
jgi:hypothetical protein